MRARAALAVLGALSLAFALPPRMASAQSALLPLIERLPSGAQRPEGVDAGPVLEGDAVVWSTVLGGHFSVRRELPGAGVPETLGSVSPSILSLEASSSQVLITAEDSCVSLEEAVGSESCSRKTAVLHADAGERLQKLAIEPFDEPSISGEWLGYSGEGGYEVRDPLNPEVAPTTLQLTGSPERGGLGYPYLATSVSSGHLQVIDTLTGKLAYTVNAHDYDSFEGIEDDGTILLAGSDDAPPAWFSAAEP